MKEHHGVNHHPHRGTRGHGRKITRSSRFTFQQTKNTTKFCAGLSIAANNPLNTHACCVSEQNPHFMEGSKMFMTQDGQTGFAVKPDGDIVGVFNNGNKRGALKTIMPMAVANGGDRLDCYGKLAGLYSRFGFVPTGRSPYNSDYVDEDDPHNKFLKDTHPDVYAMMYVGGKREFSKEELHTLPEMEYDDMLADRDARLEALYSRRDE